MKSDSEIKNDWIEIENKTIGKALNQLREYERETNNYLAHIVAALCDVDVEKMMSGVSSTHIAQARWLYWYAIRYMKNDTYEKISIAMNKESGLHFTPNGIGQSINRISEMISKEPIWTKRWTILKRIIKLRETISKDEQDVVTFRIIAPEGIKLNIKTE